MTDFLQQNFEQLVNEVPGLEDFVYTGCPEPELITALLELLSTEEQQVVVDASGRGKYWKEKLISMQKQSTLLLEENQEQNFRIYHLNNKLSILEMMLNDAREELAKLKAA